MATKEPDPSSIPTARELSDGSYDSPSTSLDHVPQHISDEACTTIPPQTTVDNEPKQPSSDEKASSSGHHVAAAAADDDPSKLSGGESGVYTTIDDFLSGEAQSDGGFIASDSDVEEGEDGEREGKRKRRLRVRESERNLDKSKIYIDGSIVQPQPMPLSFKSRVRGRSREQLEKEGIYQCLNITDEQKQQIGIMPEPLYMTATLWRSRDELESMSMEMALQANKQMSQTQTSVTPFYRGFILRPPPLPPLNQGAPTTQRKCHAIIENILKSEAAFLTSLKVAEQVYMKPLQEIANPPIDKEQVKILFGPIQDLMAHHELFYTALTQRTMDWGPKQTVGNVFMTFYRKEVVGHYVQYVNNFTDAMGTLQKNIKKRPKFVNFLRERYDESKTSLSLQGLLLKPVQRFPQYILFLQDLIKYTPPYHPDRVTLQLALARCETIAEHLNEAKRSKEQQTIVAHLSTRVTQLSFKLRDSPNRCLLMQEAVTRLALSPQEGDNIVQQKLSLLLFNNMALCATMKSSGAALPHDAGPYDDTHYKCQWSSPLDQVIVVEPDYTDDIWDYVVKYDESEEAVAHKQTKFQYLKQTQDFLTLSKIASLVPSLADAYTGLKVASVQRHMRVLQRKLARTKEEIRRNQPGRMDIQIPSWDGSQRKRHTYVFESEKAKQNWLNNLRYATLKLKEENKMAWVCAESEEDDDVVVGSSGYLPLYVQHYHLTNSSQSFSTECATNTHGNQVWFASCTGTMAEIAIIKCVTPIPIVLKSYMVDSSRILAICYAPCETSSHQSSPHLSSTSAIIGTPYLSANSETVWMGSQTGKLMIHPTSSEIAHKCIEVINFSGAITCIEYYKNQMFIAVEGNIYIYKRPTGCEWDLDNPVVMKVHSGEEPIICMCRVQQKLWIGAGNLCYVLNMLSCRIEGHFQVSRESTAVVRNMASSGSGVWMSLRRSATLQLFHTVTKTLLQDIDIEKAFLRIASKHNIQSKIHSISNLHVTSLLLCKGNLWIGTSAGTIMIYRTPYLKTVPITTGKPYMALHGHSSGVRVLISTHTVGTLSGSRLDQFISEEQEKFQEDWEATEVTEVGEEDQVPQPTPASNGIDVDATSGQQASPKDAESTFPPLPPPVFPNEASPCGTLKVGTQDNPTSDNTPDQVVAGGESRDSTISMQPLVNGHTGTAKSPETVSPISKVPQNGDSDETSLPVRRTSTKPSQKTAEGGEGAFQRKSTPDNQDTGKNIREVERNGEPMQQLHPLIDEEEGTFHQEPASDVTPSPPLYDEVTPDDSPYLDRRRSPSPYEDPTTLDLTGPIPIRPMADFFSTLNQSAIAPYGDQSTAGAIYVLTGGRGLINLQPGRRMSVHSISLSGSGDISTADESCIIAYELKH